MGYVVLVLFMMLFLGGCQQEAPEALLEPSALPEQEEKSGQQLYQANCSACHGIGGRGNPTMLAGRHVDFTDPAWQKRWSDEQIQHIIRSGRGMMPAFETRFSDEELSSLVSHVRSLAHEHE